VQAGQLKQYIWTKGKEGSSRGTTPKSNDHVTPILEDFNTIVGGFSGGGTSIAGRKRYSRAELICEITEMKPITEPIIYFSSANKAYISPHENDLVFITIITMGRNVHRVLVDQGSFADVMFLNTFEGLQIPKDQLKPFNGTLVAFNGGNVHRVLVDQGSSADVMFQNTFEGLQISKDQLKPFNGTLVIFNGGHVEV